MANIKSVAIRGTVPFNLDEHPALSRKLAQLNTPTVGLRLHYGRKAGYVPNEHGGRTAMYEFELAGQEAVNAAWLQAFVSGVEECGGTVTQATVFDIEAQQDIRLAVGKPKKAAETQAALGKTARKKLKDAAVSAIHYLVHGGVLRRELAQEHKLSEDAVRQILTTESHSLCESILDL